jgi:hypothetical protein
MEPFTASTSEGPVAFGRGAIFVPLAGQDERGDDIHAVMTEIAREDGITVHPIISGATPSVGTDFGGRISFQPVEAPRVLLLFDDGLSFYDVGEVWHLLDHRMAMPVTMVRKSELGGIDWPRYTDIIMVGGRGEISMPDEHRQRLHQWIEEGGTLIATRQSALWAQDHFLDASHQNGADNEDGPSLSNGSEEGGDTTGPARFDYADRALKDAEHVIGGSIMATDLDITHPLGFGYADRFLPSHRNTTLTLEAPADNPFAVVARYTEDPLLSGYASERRLNEIAGTPMLRAERVRGGAVIAFTDNPVFRGTFLGTNKAFLNAIFFGDLIQPPRGDYGPYEGQDASD